MTRSDVGGVEHLRTGRVNAIVASVGGRRLTTRTLAPNAWGGMLERNLALTTPALPCGRLTLLQDEHVSTSGARSMRNAPPDHADLRTLPLGFCAVHVGETLASGRTVRTARKHMRAQAYLSEVELRVLLRADTLDLDEGCVRTRVALAALVAENTALGVEAEEEYV
jgi:hypothetical protein